MARPLRLQRPDAWYHLCARATERSIIYRSDRERAHWLELFPELVERFRVQIFAYAMMANHYHLLLAAPDLNLSKAMQWFQTSYSMWFNRKHRRVGPLVQGRFHAATVEPAAFGLELSRYVHLNPVRVLSLGLDKDARRAARVGIDTQTPPHLIRQRVEHLRQYRWSSYRAYIGAERPPEWLERKPILDACSRGSIAEQQQAYRKYAEEAVRDGLEESFWEQFTGKVAFGSKEWMRKLGATLRGRLREQPAGRRLRPRPELEAIVAAVEKIRGLPWKDFRGRRGDWGRDMVWYLGWHHGGATLAILGQAAGGADYAAVSAAIKSMQRKVGADRRLRGNLRQARQTLGI